MKSFWIALQFLTRLKLVSQTEWTVEDFGKSVLSFPVVGLIIGLCMLAVYGIFSSVLPHNLLMLLLVVFEFLLTGGLHADGFMDTCDGLFSGRDRERKLEIMKDSRIGSNGVVGFVFLVVLKWQLLVALTNPWLLGSMLIIMPLMSRYTMGFSIVGYPYARPEGMGKAFSEFAPPNTKLYTTLVMLGLLVIMGTVSVSLTFYITHSIQTFYTTHGGILFDTNLLMQAGILLVFIALYVLMLLVALLANYILNRYITKHLGGTTGDTYGFVTELTEVVILFVCVLFFA